MLKKIPFLFLVSLIVLIGSVLAKDKVTEIKVNVVPATAKIRPSETAIIHVEFFGTKKKGFFGSLLGEETGEKSRVQSGKWKVSFVGSNIGLLSKRFLYQKEGTKTKSGFSSFLRQGLGAASSKDSVLFTAPNKTGKYRVKITEGNLSKEITITVSNSARSLKTPEKAKFITTKKPSDPYFYLAAHYAPFIAQETWFNPKADFLARFDYDGNWKGEDNWENLAKGSSQAYVYYAAMETKTHWFLIYNFYHPRDYSDVCVVGTCHENDNEGLILTIRKDKSKFGKLEVLESLAHNNIYSFSNNKRIKKGIHNIDGKLTVDKNSRPIIFIEAGGHGVYACSYKKSLFSPKIMTFKKNTGITYVYKGIAERPKNANSKNVGYALLSIYEQWWKKGNKETDESTDTFDMFYTYQPFGNRPRAKTAFISGAFKGRTAGKNNAKPFWAWHDRRTKKKRVLNTGQWALDPAYGVSKNLKFPSDLPVSTEYVFNPYLDLEDKQNLPR